MGCGEEAEVRVNNYVTAEESVRGTNPYMEMIFHRILDLTGAGYLSWPFFLDTNSIGGKSFCCGQTKKTLNLKL